MPPPQQTYPPLGLPPHLRSFFLTPKVPLDIGSVGATEDPSTPAPVFTATTTSTTASFTPPASSLLVAICSVGASTGTVTGTVTDSLSGTWTLRGRQNAAAAGSAEIWVRDVGLSPAAMTVTLTGSAGNSTQLSVRVVTGAAPVAQQYGTVAVKSTSPVDIPVTSAAAGSLIYASMVWTSASLVLVPDSHTTAILSTQDSTNGQTNGSARMAGLTFGAGGNTLGWTNAVAAQAIAVEIVAALVMAPASLRATSTGNTGATNATSFTIAQPTGLGIGDYCLLWVDVGSTGQTVTATGFTAVTPTSGNSQTAALLYRVITGTESWPLTVSYGTSSQATGIIYAAQGATGFDVTPTSSGQTNASSQVVTTAAVTTTKADDLLVWFGACSSASGGAPNVITAPTGMTARCTQSNSASTTTTNLGALCADSVQIPMGTTTLNGSIPSPSRVTAGLLVTIAGGGIPVDVGVVALSATAGMTVGATVTEVATVSEAATAGMAVGPTNPKVSTIADTFIGSNGSAPNATLWVPFGTSPTVTSIQSNQLNVAITASDTNYGGVESAGLYDLTSSAIFVQGASAGNQSLASLEYFPLQLNDAPDLNTIFFYVNSGILYSFVRVNTTTGGSRVTATYSPTTHAWFRIREASGTVYFETSPDGVTWSVFDSLADPFPTATMQALQVQMAAGCYASEVSSTTCAWDNLNVVTGATTLAATAGMTIGAVVTENAAVALAGTASMTPAATVTEVAAITEAATAGMTVTASLTVLASAMGPNPNLLSADDQDFEGSVGTWTATSICTIAQTTAQANTGTHSLAVTSTAASGIVQATSGRYAASPGWAYTYRLWVRAATTTRVPAILATYINSSLAQISSFSIGATESNSAWNQTPATTSIAPPGTAWVTVGWQATNVPIGEVHYTDTIQLYQPAGANAVLTVSAYVTEVASVAHSATAGMTIGASVTEIAAVALAGGASLTAPAVVTEIATVAEAASAGMTIGALVTEVASMAESATAGMSVTATTIGGITVTLAAGAALTITAIDIEVAVVAESAGAALSVAATVTEQAVVALAAATGLVPSGMTQEVASVVEAATTSLSPAATVKEVAAIAQTGTASLSVTAVLTISATVAEAASAAMTVTPKVTEVASLAQAATTSMTITALVTEVAAVSMAASTLLSLTPIDIGSATLAASAAMTVVSTVTEVAVVALAGSTTLTAAATVKEVAIVALSGSTNLTATATLTRFGVAALAGTAGLTITASVTEVASIPLAASTTLTVITYVQVVATVSLSATASMSVTGVVIHVVSGAVALSAQATLVPVGILVAAGAVTFNPISALSLAAGVMQLASAYLAATTGMVVLAEVIAVLPALNLIRLGAALYPLPIAGAPPVVNQAVSNLVQARATLYPLPQAGAPASTTPNISTVVRTPGPLYPYPTTES
jgi:trimeric autotransporter adhesin